MKKSILMAIIVMMFFAFNGCLSARDKALKQIEEDEIRPVSSIVISEEDARRLNEKLPVHLYFSDRDCTKLVAEIRYLSMDEAKQGTEQLASALVKELVKGPSNSELRPTIPEGASLRSPVKLEGRTATVDMTKEFIDNHPGGKENEEITIFSIVNTLTELKDIERVCFLINGKAEKEFKGGFRFDNEFPRNESLIDRKQSYSTMPMDQNADGYDFEGYENVSIEENPEIEILE
jgi:germination protein M